MIFCPANWLAHKFSLGQLMSTQVFTWPTNGPWLIDHWERLPEILITHCKYPVTKLPLTTLYCMYKQKYQWVKTKKCVEYQKSSARPTTSTRDFTRLITGSIWLCDHWLQLKNILMILMRMMFAITNWKGSWLITRWECEMNGILITCPKPWPSPLTRVT